MACQARRDNAAWRVKRGAIGRIAQSPKKVIFIEEGKVNIHAAFLMFASGQLRFLGLLQYFKQAVQAAFVDGHHGLLTHFGFGVVGH